ncbi:MAG: Gfo/Idh/MocA family oxidoreductase [Ignavibacteria bacterium]|nr:Gfo/Idh/MocA family oxidoreductase [Ignavibacteria bacterium]
MLKIAVIGYGYWGPNLLRNFYNLDDCTVVAVCDPRPERLRIVQKNYPAVKTTLNLDDIIKNHDIEAVAIATPVRTHYELAKLFLENGKHVLIEKPMSDSYEKCCDLIHTADKFKKVLMVDHTFLYTGAVNSMKKFIKEGVLGKILYFDSTRINLGLFQSDINVLWDLAAHDLSILFHLIEEKPSYVQAIGVSHTDNKIENIAYMFLHYDSGLIAHLSCSWASPVKVRYTLIGGDKKMIVYNDIEATEKVKIYDTGYNVRTDEDKKSLLIDYRVGDVYIPKVDIREALAYLAEDFRDAVVSAKKPVSSREVGMEVVKVLEASDKSLKNKGSLIKLS